MIPRTIDYLACQRILSYDADSLAAMQARRLQTTIRHAYRNVPYYRRLFDSAGVKPDDIRTPDDLVHIPMSSKADLLDAGYDDLVAKTVDPEALLTSHTTGSTGTAFSVRRTPADVRKRKFQDLRLLIRFGFRPWDRLATYTVRQGHPGNNPQRLIYRGRWFSAFDPVEKTIAELSTYKPTQLWAYPSSFRALVEYANGDLTSVCAPRFVVTTSEEPDEFVRDACERLGLGHFNFYGAVECGRIAWECTAHAGLHVSTDNVVLEVLPTELSRRFGSEELGETVITTLNNEAMPFIRYRLGDLCHWLEQPCSCGVALPLISAPIGRSSDVLTLPSGRIITARGLALVIRRHREVRQFLTVQQDTRNISIQIVADHPRPAELMSVMTSQVQEYLGEPMKIDLRMVDSIVQSGPKAASFISHVGSRQA